MCAASSPPNSSPAVERRLREGSHLGVLSRCNPRCSNTPPWTPKPGAPRSFKSAARVAGSGQRCGVDPHHPRHRCGLGAVQGQGGHRLEQGLVESVKDGIKLAGLVALVSPAVAAGNAWAVDKSQVRVVSSKDAAFANDAFQIRAVSRVGFGFANPSGVVRLYDAA